MTNKELSAAIRDDLKKAGIPKSAYSIRVQWAGYERSITIKVKDISVNIDRVNRVLLHYQHVYRDERCGEILAGGNTYAHADYDYKMMDLESERFQDRAAELMAADLPLFVGQVVATYSRNGHDRELLYFKGDQFMVARKKGGSSIGNQRHYAGDVRSIAKALALFDNLGAIPKY
ncbi:MAG: hypothetical protein IJ153_05610 [Clostridia bacterium]|nr:hypothetical protein [Clostridia bacterium]MBQ9211161.1 hypothetical protein [Clostridia bacterium]